MSSLDDERAEMRAFDDLLAGLIGPDEAPPALREVARLVRIARGPATGEELAGEKLLSAEVAAAVRQSLPLPARSPWRRRVVRLASVKAAGLAAAILVGGGVAAAATGSLPAPMQRIVAKSLHHIGVSLPLPSKQANPPAVTPPVRSVPARSAALCRAYDLRPAAVSSVGLEELRRLAGASGEGVASYCETLLLGHHHLPPSTTAASSAVPGSRASGSESSKGAGRSSKGHGQRRGAGHPLTTTPHRPAAPASAGSHRHKRKGTEPRGGGQRGTGDGKGRGSNPGKGVDEGSSPGQGSGSAGTSTPGAGTSGTTGGSGRASAGGSGGSARGGHLIQASQGLAHSSARIPAEIGSIGTSVGKGA